MSMRELSYYIDGRRAADQLELRRQIDAAYLTAMLMKTDPKKFPDDPSKFYPKPRLTRKQRAQENRERMLALRDARNASLKKKKTPADAPPKAKNK